MEKDNKVMQIIELDRRESQMKLEVINAEFEQLRNLIISACFMVGSIVDNGDKHLTVYHKGKVHDFIKGCKHDLIKMRNFYEEVNFIGGAA